MRRHQRPQLHWARCSEEELLQTRVRDLELEIDGTPLQQCIEQLYDELAAAGIDFRPPCYVSDEWASPEGVAAIGIPFFLTHPRLRRLEKKMMLEVEGGEHNECMRILRHEAGHAINHGYKLHTDMRWRELFGTPDQEYREVYRVRPNSRKYVRNLRHWYAQMHPDEDFAETFAVWLDPHSDWQHEYACWAALEKLHYVDGKIRGSVAGRAPRAVPRKREFIYRASRMKTRLGNLYDRRRARARRNAPGFAERDLRRIFSGSHCSSKRRAAPFLRRRRREILQSVSRWGGESTYTISVLLRNVERRCEELDLRLGRSERETMVDVSSFLMTLVVNNRYARLTKERT